MVVTVYLITITEHSEMKREFKHFGYEADIILILIINSFIIELIKIGKKLLNIEIDIQISNQKMIYRKFCSEIWQWCNIVRDLIVDSFLPEIPLLVLLQNIFKFK